MLFRLWQATPYHDSPASGRGEAGLYPTLGLPLGDAVFPA
jgi:hypothetical protein